MDEARLTSGGHRAKLLERAAACKAEHLRLTELVHAATPRINELVRKAGMSFHNKHYDTMQKANGRSCRHKQTPYAFPHMETKHLSNRKFSILFLQRTLIDNKLSGTRPQTDQYKIVSNHSKQGMCRLAQHRLAESGCADRPAKKPRSLRPTQAAIDALTKDSLKSAEHNQKNEKHKERDKQKTKK